MSSKAMSLKARINKYAKSNDIAAQVVLQNYLTFPLFHRFEKMTSMEVSALD